MLELWENVMLLGCFHLKSTKIRWLFKWFYTENVKQTLDYHSTPFPALKGLLGLVHISSRCGSADKLVAARLLQLQLFSSYHLQRHILILLISDQFLQGYLSTWRKVRAVSRYGIGSMPFPPLWLLSTRQHSCLTGPPEVIAEPECVWAEKIKLQETWRVSFCVTLGPKRGRLCARPAWRDQTAACTEREEDVHGGKM